MVARYVDLDSERGLAALGSLTMPRAIQVTDGNPRLGMYSYQAYDAPEVLTAQQTGELLQLAEGAVLQLAEAGQLPGRRLGAAWRFSRQALIAWLADPDPAAH